MIGIVVVGHNRFAQGVSSTVEMIAGKQDKYIAVDFLDGSSHSDLFESIEKAVKELNEEGVLIFTDLKGGTPFQQSVMVAMQNENVEVLTGTNVAMLLEGSLMRMAAENVQSLALALVNTGKNQVDRFDASSLNKAEEESEDGI